jgi:hypothetical protein
MYTFQVWYVVHTISVFHEPLPSTNSFTHPSTRLSTHPPINHIILQKHLRVLTRNCKYVRYLCTYTKYYEHFTHTHFNWQY